jgi:predicted RNA-binding Zn-ribbon protein involved in translation (DUF1610 family)
MKILLIDIETAPNRGYFWGLFNQNISIDMIDKPGYILCWSAKWYGEKKVMFSSLWGDGKKKMLKKAYDLLEEADVVVHYNGINFDNRWFNAEFAKMGWTPPAPHQPIDLLLTTKRQFRLPSHKLEFALQYFGLGKKYKHDGWPMWEGCITGDKYYQKEMQKYNEQDVTEMEPLYVFLRPWIMNHPNHALYDSKGEYQCPNCGGTYLRKKGLRYTSVFTYQRYKCNDCGAWSQERQNNMSKEEKAVVLKGI